MSKIFLSHSSKDKTFVRHLSHDLMKSGHSVWFDELEIKVGDDLIGKIQDGLKAIKYLILILSPDSVKSPWVEREWKSLMMDEINNDNVRILPILLKDCDIPMFLKAKRYANFSNNYKEGLSDLMKVIIPKKKLSNRNGRYIVWYLDDSEGDLKKFNERHKKYFDIKLFRDPIDMLKDLDINQNKKDKFPDILLVDLYIPITESEADRRNFEAAKKKLDDFFNMEKVLKDYVDKAWKPYGVDVVRTIREEYSAEQLPVSIYTQRGLVLLDDDLIMELEKLNVTWLLKNQFSAETDRLIMNKIMKFPKNKIILVLDDNPKFQNEFKKKQGIFYDIENINDQGQLLEKIERMDAEGRFPHLLLVDLYYPRGCDSESKKNIDAANEKLKEFHNREKKMKELVKKVYDPFGVIFINQVRRKYNESDLPILIYSYSGLLMLDDQRIQNLTSLDTGWMLKNRYSSRTEQIKIISHIEKLK